MDKMKIAVLFGGASPEYSVSLQSAYAVITGLDKTRFQPVMVGISQEGEWFSYAGPVENILRDTWRQPAWCTPAAVSPSPKDHGLLLFAKERVEKLPVDAAFPVLHGKNGEDGTVQGLFALAGIPLVGCGVLASALCMDKDRAHRLSAAAGIAVPKSFVLGQGDRGEALTRGEELGFPLFVKPLRAGSSYGITRVLAREELPAALELAFAYDSRVILEESIPGFETGCAVLGDDALTVGGPDEVELSQGFFDFREKYAPKTSAVHVPARVSPEKAEELKAAAKTVYRALGCQSFARVDLFLEPSGRIVFNEVNTIPGFTPHSRYPAMMAAAGIPFPEVLSRLIGLALDAGKGEKGGANE